MAEILKALASFGIEVWMGVLSAVLTFAVEVLLCTKGVITFRGERRLQKAKELGHVVRGKRVSWQRMEDNGSKKTEKYVGRYEYVVDGRVYRGMVISPQTAPNKEENFYYLSNPRKAFTEYDTAKKPGMVLLYIIPFLVAYAVMRAMGWQPT